VNSAEKLAMTISRIFLLLFIFIQNYAPALNLQSILSLLSEISHKMKWIKDFRWAHSGSRSIYGEDFT